MEIGSVHDGSFGNAKKAIEFGASIGVDAIKFQLHIADAETTSYAPNPEYFKDESRQEYFLRTSFSLAQWQNLFEYAKSLGIDFVVSPFSIEAVDVLDQIGVKTLKIASGEVTNLPLLDRINATEYSVILSTGMASYQEIDQAIETLSEVKKLSILQCTSAYPCLRNTHLPVMKTTGNVSTCSYWIFRPYKWPYSWSRCCHYGRRIDRKALFFFSYNVRE